MKFLFNIKFLKFNSEEQYKQLCKYIIQLFALPSECSFRRIFLFVVPRIAGIKQGNPDTVAAVLADRAFSRQPKNEKFSRQFK